MSAEDDAYRAAQAMIARAKEQGAETLDLNTPDTRAETPDIRALARLPPEITDLPALRSLTL